MTRLLLSSAALVSLLSATAAQPAPSAAPLDPRFGLRGYRSGERQILVDALPDRLALRASPDVDPALLALLVEQALVKVADATGEVSGVGEAPRRLQAHGLFDVALTAPLSRAALSLLARAVQEVPEVERVYPVLSRMTGRAYYDEHLVITAAPGALDDVLEKALEATGGVVVRRSRVPNTALLRVGDRFGKDAVDASAALAGLEGLVSAEPNLYRELMPTALVDDPLFPGQWHLSRGEGDAVPGDGQIFAAEAWDVTMGNPAVVVAVFDTGTDVTHEDLAPNIVGGFDAVTGDDDPSAECSSSPDGRDIAPSCPDNLPFRESHGTSVSGTIAARGNNALGVTGVCPMCSLMPVRLLGGESQGGLSIAEAFVRAVDEGAWVINNSWGPGASVYFPLSQAERDAFEYARTVGRGGKGTVILFAAGNETTDVNLDAYAATHLTLAVSASTNLDDFALYSNYGRQIDLAAPSMGGTVDADSYGIVTTDVPGEEGYSEDAYNLGFGGTSAASPIAAGVAALVLSTNPELTAEQVRIALTSTADKIRADKVNWPAVIGQDLAEIFDYDERGHSIGFGFGRVNAARAVAYALEPGLHGASCEAEGCEVCGVTGRCQPRCNGQADCPDGTTCTGGTCALPVPSHVEIGQPCHADCAFCVAAADTEFAPTEVCTDVCEVDSDCPAGFDCRLIEAGGPRICAVGSSNAGEPADAFNCFGSSLGVAVIVEGSDGQPYCSDICLSDGPGACPYGFYCGYASCECTGQSNWGCYEYTCTEAGPNGGEFPACFPKEGYGVECETDDDCKLGDYCTQEGRCAVDDREGCTVCQTCTSNEECGPRGICFGLRNNPVGRCTRVCDADGGCPGNAACTEVEVHFGTLALCTSPNPPVDEVCEASWTCEVACRDDVPCEDGFVCEEGACVPVEEDASGSKGTDGPVPQVKEPTGCDCQSTSDPSLLGLALALGLFGLRRRRR